METPEPDESPPSLQGWPDSSAIAVISWRSETGEVYRQEVADNDEALDLTQKIAADDQLELVSVQVRRAGIGPDS